MTNFEDHLRMIEDSVSDLANIADLPEILRRLNGLQRRVFDEVEKRNTQQGKRQVKHTRQSSSISCD